jgi:hypothetical protein
MLETQMKNFFLWTFIKFKSLTLLFIIKKINTTFYLIIEREANNKVKKILSSGAEISSLEKSTEGTLLKAEIDHSCTSVINLSLL